MKRFTSSKEFIDAFPQWEKELTKIYQTLSSTKLDETMKWGMPTFAYKSKNVAGMGAFKSYVGIWFFQGALLEDKAKVLLNAQEGTTRALRQWRFKNVKDIDTKLIKQYVKESIINVESGNEIKPKKKKQVEIPSELKTAIAKTKIAQTNFNKLTPFKQREYADYIADAKREETKIKRLDKILPMIKKGIGLHDKYR